MKIHKLYFLIALLGCCAIAKAEDAAWSTAYDQWKAALDQAEQRRHAIDDKGGHAARTVDDALSRAEQSKGEIQRLASSLRDRASQIESATFNAKFAKDEFESAKRDADRFDQQMDQKAKSLRDDFARLGEQSPAVDEKLENLKPKLAHLREWSEQIESRRRVFHVPSEQGALDAFNADVNQYNAEKDRYNAERDSVTVEVDKWNQWRGQLLEIQKLIVEDGRHVLQLRQVESKKEREYAEAQEKLDKFNTKQSEEAQQLATLMGPSYAALQGLVDALDTPAPVQFNSPVVGGSYARQDDTTAQAVGLPPSNAAERPATHRLRDRIFVLPPPDAQSPDQAQNGVTSLQVRMDLAADDLAGQYRQVDRVPQSVGPTGATVLEGTGSLGTLSPNSAGTNETATVQNGDSLPSLDPRRLISRGDYESALAARDRLNQLLPKLQAQLEKVRDQRGKTLGYENEFEEIRAETARGALRDALGALPVSGILKKLAADPSLAKSLTPEVISRVDLAMKALRMEIGREHASLVPDTQEQRKQRVEVIRQGAEALLSVCANQLPEGGGSHLMLEQMGKMLQVYNKFSDYLNDPKSGERPPWQELGEVVKLGINVAGVYCAPVALGVGVESLGERAVTRVIIQSAMEDLSDSLKSNYDADRFLTAKIERTQGFVNELNRTVEGYQVVHGPHAPTPQATVTP
jgi:hypothetical protein